MYLVPFWTGGCKLQYFEVQDSRSSKGLFCSMYAVLNSSRSYWTQSLVMLSKSQAGSGTPSVHASHLHMGTFAWWKNTAEEDSLEVDAECFPMVHTFPSSCRFVNMECNSSCFWVLSERESRSSSVAVAFGHEICQLLVISVGWLAPLLEQVHFIVWRLGCERSVMEKKSLRTECSNDPSFKTE